MQRHAARRSAGCSFIHSASCGAPIRQDCIETSAKSEVVTVCSWQFAGEERLQSTAMMLIMTGEPRRREGRWHPLPYDLLEPCSAYRLQHRQAGRYCHISRELLELGGLVRAQTSGQ